MTDKNIEKHVKSMADRVIDCGARSVQALGFLKAVEYKKVRMFVSDTMVLADMTPLAFLSLSEPIEQDGMETAAVRLYERVRPLLSCDHAWTDVTDVGDEQIKTIVQSLPSHSARLFQCASCTALARGTSISDLPATGKGDL